MSQRINWSINTAYQAPAKPNPMMFTKIYPKLTRITIDPTKMAINGHTVSPAPLNAPEVIH